MGKYIGFIFCIVFGIFMMGLSLISDDLHCSRYDNLCALKSKILFVNYNISKDEFRVSDIDNAYCEKMYQPSRRGKKAYFVLKMMRKDTNNAYILGSFQKLPMCKNELNPLENFINGKTDTFSYSSGIGTTNALGLILSVLLFIVAIIIITNKEEQKTYEWEEDEE